MIRLRENLQETKDFPIEYRVFPVFVPLNQSMKIINSALNQQFPMVSMEVSTACSMPLVPGAGRSFANDGRTGASGGSCVC